MLTAVTSVLLGVSVSLTTPAPQAPLIAIIAIACTFPLVLRVVRGTFDLFEPLVIANVALLVMYVFRPIALFTAETSGVFKGYDLASTRIEALVVAAVGVIALQVAYALPWGRRLAGRLPRPPARWSPSRTVGFSYALILVASVLFGIFLLQSGGLSVALDLAQGRRAEHDALYRDSTAYFHAAPQLLFPAALLLFGVGLAERRRELVVISVLPLVPLAAFSAGGGSRIILLPLLTAPAIYWYLHRNRRPGPLVIAIATYLALTVGIAYFREVRTQDAGVSKTEELERAVTDPRFEYEQLINKGVDNDMFESLAVNLQVIPEKIDPNPIDFAVRTAAKPVPAVLWKNKPLAPEDRLKETLYPAEPGRASSSSGIIGNFYLGGAVPGVLVGMLLVGLIFRLFWEYWRRYPDRSTAQVLLAASVVFVPILLRGSVGDTLARALFGVLPLLVAFKWCTREKALDAAASPRVA